MKSLADLLNIFFSAVTRMQRVRDSERNCFCMYSHTSTRHWVERSERAGSVSFLPPSLTWNPHNAFILWNCLACVSDHWHTRLRLLAGNSWLTNLLIYNQDTNTTFCQNINCNAGTNQHPECWSFSLFYPFFYSFLFYSCCPVFAQICWTIFWM